MGRMDTLGGSLGPRIAKVTADAVLATRLATHPQVARLAVHAANDFLDQVTREVQANTGELWARLADDPDAPAWARRTFGFLARGRGQWSAMLGQTLVGSTLGNAVVDLVSNELNPIITNVIAKNPNAYLDPATAAQGHNRGIIPAGDAYAEGARKGFGRQRFQWLVKLAYHMPPPAETLDLLNRRVITEGQARDALVDAAVHPDWVDRVLRLRKTNLAPVALASMVVRGILSEENGAAQAAFSGVTADDFRNLVADTGQSMAVQDLLTAYRRGIIDRARLEHGIRTGNLRNEWIPVVEALRYSPMSVADAVAAVVQGHLQETAARAITEDNGLLPEHFTPLLATAGNPPGPETAGSMWRRGIMSRAEAEQAIRESALKNKYIPAVLAHSERLLPMDNVRIAYRERVIDAAEAIRRLTQLGFSVESARVLVAESQAQRNTQSRDLTQGLIADLYRDRAITAAEAESMLVTLGYDREEAGLRLAIVDLQRLRQFTDSAIARVRGLYVGHKINRSRVAADLDALHVPADQRASLLTLWDLERAANVRLLTPSEVARAFARGIIGVADARAELVRQGYDAADAEVVLRLALPKGG